MMVCVTTLPWAALLACPHKINLAQITLKNVFMFWGDLCFMFPSKANVKVITESLYTSISAISLMTPNPTAESNIYINWWCGYETVHNFSTV
jgi:hypothetical protein